jgi:hypothetical protein
MKTRRPLDWEVQCRRAYSSFEKNGFLVLVDGKQVTELDSRLDPSAFVVAYLGMGDKAKTLDWLEKAYAQHSNTMTTLKVDPIFDRLRGDPHFEDLVRRVGL